MYCRNCKKDMGDYYFPTHKVRKTSCPACGKTLERKSIQHFNIGGSQSAQNSHSGNHPDDYIVRGVIPLCEHVSLILGEHKDSVRERNLRNLVIHSN